MRLSTTGFCSVKVYNTAGELVRTLWDRPVTVAGIPLLPLAIFGGWAVLIAVAAWVAEAPEDEGGP